ncbi:hypothetical protein ACJ41O_013260 [Fusarium nematophilum]
MDKNVRGVTKEAYESAGRAGCPDPIFDDLWDEEDESALRAIWDRSAVAVALSQAHPQITTVFKVSLRLFKCDPLTLFASNGCNIVFDKSENFDIKAGGREVKSPLWSKQLCNKLMRIMSHPIFWKERKKTAFFLLTIKWAVICRTDDRRPLNEAELELLERVGCSLGPDEPGKSFSERHEDYQRSRWRQGDRATQEAGLFRSISAQTKVLPPAAAPVEGDPYRVTSGDLLTVIKGLGDLEMHGGLSLDCEVYFQLFQASRSQTGYPAAEDIKALYKNCWLSVQRNKTQGLRIEAQPSSNQHADSGELFDSDMNLAHVAASGDDSSGAGSDDDAFVPQGDDDETSLGSSTSSIDDQDVGGVDMGPNNGADEPNLGESSSEAGSSDDTEDIRKDKDAAGALPEVSPIPGQRDEEGTLGRARRMAIGTLGSRMDLDDADESGDDDSDEEPEPRHHSNPKKEPPPFRVRPGPSAWISDVEVVDLDFAPGRWGSGKRH